jgi:hypothetical protein
MSHYHSYMHYLSISGLVCINGPIYRDFCSNPGRQLRTPYATVFRRVKWSSIMVVFLRKPLFTTVQVRPGKWWEKVHSSYMLWFGSAILLCRYFNWTDWCQYRNKNQKIFIRHHSLYFIGIMLFIVIDAKSANIYKWII